MDQILQIVLGIDATENVETAASTIVAGDMSEPLWYAISVNCGRIQINPRFGRQIKKCDLAKNGAGAIPTTKEDHNILVGEIHRRMAAAGSGSIGQLPPALALDIEHPHVLTD